MFADKIERKAQPPSWPINTIGTMLPAVLILVLILTGICATLGYSQVNLNMLRGNDFRNPLSEEVLDQAYRSPLEVNPYATDGVIVDSLYIIGPGDQFQVYIESMVLDKQVNAEGNILITKAGVIPVEGLSLKEAKKRILERVQATKIKSQCYVNLSRPKSMKVFITGAANLPGVYQIEGNLRLSDVMAKAQWFSAQAQRGEIQVTSKDGTVNKVDLQKFLHHGDLNSNPYLTQGAVIFIPFLDFKSPMVTIQRDGELLPIQLENDDTIIDLILKFSSFRALLPYTAISVKEKNGTVKYLTPEEAYSHRPEDKAYIEIFSQKQAIYVGGAVARPGFIAYKSEYKILQYISEAGLLPSSKLPKKMTVFRAEGNKEVVNIGSGIVKPGDMILVDQSAEQRFIIYTPILLSLASFTLAIVNLLQSK